MSKRILSGLAGILFLISIIYYLPKIYFFFLILFSILISLFEFFHITEKKKYSKKFFFSCLTAIIFSFLFKNCELNYILFSIISFILICFIIQIYLFKNFSATINDTVKFIVANIYISFFLNFALLIFYFPNGRNLIMLLLLISWATDSFAYFTGIRFGKHKLYKELSPNKTVEGAIGGIIGAIVVGLIFNYFVLKFSFLYIILILLITSVFCIFGDLFESMIKRLYGVKDSGNIIPGHGGLLDRIDSLFFAVPVFYILINGIK